MRRKPPETASGGPSLGRVAVCHGRHSFIDAGCGRLLEAYRRGRRTDVVVGDKVRYREMEGGTAAIEEVLPRASLLYRSDEFRVKELAANIDLVAVVFASRPAFNNWFIWKALLAAAKARIEPLVIRNKTDLAEGAEEAAAALALVESLGCRTASVSATCDPEGARAALEVVLKGRRALLIGQSGMGKSTILNLLVPGARARTQEFSEALDTGRQTTTAARWYPCGADGAIVDSPGFQEFGLRHLDHADIVSGMPDIAREAAKGCRFLDCRHMREPGCAVKDALGRGEVSQARYEFYQAMAKAALNKASWG